MRLIKENNKWFDKGARRRTQIASWLVEDYLGKRFRSQSQTIKQLIINNKMPNAYALFNDILDEVIREGDTLGYLIKENQDQFGKTDVTVYLFGSIYGNFFRKDVKKGIKPRKATKHQLAKTFLEGDQIRKYGLNKQGTKEYAKLIITSHGQFKLQSQKTGKFLKMPESLKQQIKTNGNNKQ